MRVSYDPTKREAEIFYTLQGEGRSIGRPATFLRLSGCNLNCSWCDTPYTWDWDNYTRSEQQEEIAPTDLADRIAKFNKAKLLVITGGEPMLKQKQIKELWDILKKNSSYDQLEIETNGTIRILEDLDARYNVSPKLSNSGMPFHKRITKHLHEYKTDVYKFVVDTPTDLGEIDFITLGFNIKPEHVWLMPQGQTREAILEKLGWVTEACLDKGYNLTPRLHTLIWGAKRGK